MIKKTIISIYQAFLHSRQGIIDTIVSTIPQGVGVLTGFFGSVLIARGLGPDALGQYALVMSFSGIALSLSDLGVGQTAIRFASRADSDGLTSKHTEVLRWALRWRLALVFSMTTLLYILVPYIASLWRVSSLTGILRLGLMTGVFAAISSVPSIYFQSKKKFFINAKVLTTQRLLAFIGILAIYLINIWSIRNIVIASLASTAIGAIIFIIIVPFDALWKRGELTFNSRFFKQYFSNPNIGASNKYDSSSPMNFLKYQVIATIVVMVTLRTDVWMMGFYLDKYEIGIYSVAVRFTLPLTIILNALTTALWPRASGVRDHNKNMQLFKTTFKWTLALSLIMTIYAIVAPNLATIIFGTEYAESTRLGQILSLRYCVSILICPIGIIGYNYGLVKASWIFNIVQLIAVIFINMIFLPKIGALASAYALLVNEIIGAFMTGTLIFYRKDKLNVYE